MTEPLHFLCCSARSDLRFLPPPHAPRVGGAVVLQLFYFQRVRPQGFRFHFSFPHSFLPPTPHRPGAERKKKNTLQILFPYGDTSEINTGVLPVPQAGLCKERGHPHPYPTTDCLLRGPLPPHVKDLGNVKPPQLCPRNKLLCTVGMHWSHLHLCPSWWGWQEAPGGWFPGKGAGAGLLFFWLGVRVRRAGWSPARALLALSSPLWELSCFLSRLPWWEALWGHGIAPARFGVCCHGSPPWEELTKVGGETAWRWHPRVRQRRALLRVWWRLRRSRPCRGCCCSAVRLCSSRWRRGVRCTTPTRRGSRRERPLRARTGRPQCLQGGTISSEGRAVLQRLPGSLLRGMAEHPL